LLNQAAVKVGLAGLGNFGKLHARVLSQLPQARVVAICVPDEGDYDPEVACMPVQSAERQPATIKETLSRDRSFERYSDQTNA
jgi:predicted dehydrogenase